MTDREPGGEFVSETRAERGLVPCVSQSRSLDLSMLCPVEENDARIRAVAIGETYLRVQIVYDGGFDPRVSTR